MSEKIVQLNEEIDVYKRQVLQQESFGRYD